MNIVCIGGGTGLPIALRASRPLATSLTAIVATTDNGGSTGQLRRSSETIAWGDIRKCIHALSTNVNALKGVFNHRFEQRGSIGGHCVGNLLLHSLNQQCSTPTQTTQVMAEIMGVKSSILPMSNGVADLVATNHNGATVVGECAIDALQVLPNQIRFSSPIKSTPQVIDAINNADLIAIGPGSLITSVYPVLMLADIQDAIKKSTAEKVLLANLEPENSVVDSLSSHQAVAWIVKQVGFQFFDKIITQKPVYRFAPNCIADLYDEITPQLHDIYKLRNALVDNIAIKAGWQDKYMGSNVTSLKVS